MKRLMGIIGYGNMGSAICQQLKSDYQIFIYDKDKNKTPSCGESFESFRKRMMITTYGRELTWPEVQEEMKSINSRRKKDRILH